MPCGRCRAPPGGRALRCQSRIMWNERRWAHYTSWLTWLFQSRQSSGQADSRPQCTLCVMPDCMAVQDLDVDVRLALPARAHAALLAQIATDTELLQALHVMDYSLLLGLHFPRWGSAWFPPHSAPVRAHLRCMSGGGCPCAGAGARASCLMCGLRTCLLVFCRCKSAVKLGLAPMKDSVSEASRPVWKSACCVGVQRAQGFCSFRLHKANLRARS